MIDQTSFDRLLGAYFAEGTDELADRVIDAALAEIDHTHQRHALRMPRRFPAMPMLARVAAAAVLGVVAVGGAFYLMQPGQPAVGAPGSTAGQGSPSPSAPTASTTPAATPKLVPAPTPLVPALTGPMGVGRQIHAATVLKDGSVLVTGGFDNHDQALDAAVLYDPTGDRFTPTGPLTTARGLHTATLLSDGRVLVTGGGPASWTSPDPFLRSIELYDPTAGVFTNAGSLTTTREDHTATRLPDGRVLIAGGDDADGHSIASAELYDPTTGLSTTTGSMITARGFHTATLLKNGKVLIVGGGTQGWTGSAAMASAELFDPTTGTFTATGSMTEPRLSHTATLLPDGRVLVTGGWAGSTEISSAELYDPTKGTFTATGSMSVGRVYHTATRLVDGRVLVVGGGGDYANTTFLSSAELYDPQTGTFTTTGSMADARTFQTASLLADGRVLVTGGFGNEAPLASAEIYDPITGTFSPAGAGG